ncbi:MAG TPA: hypothetical protein VGF67_25435 [Ktedonobacteraceae bacterium]
MKDRTTMSLVCARVSAGPFTQTTLKQNPDNARVLFSIVPGVCRAGKHKSRQSVPLCSGTPGRTCLVDKAAKSLRGLHRWAVYSLLFP